MMDVVIEKSSIGWHLEELEAATQIDDSQREADSDDESVEGEDERPRPL